MNKITTNSTRRRYGQMDDLANGNCSSVTGDWSGLSDDFTWFTTVGMQIFNMTQIHTVPLDCSH